MVRPSNENDLEPNLERLTVEHVRAIRNGLIEFTGPL